MLLVWKKTNLVKWLKNKEVEQSLGSGENRVLSQGEMINRENLSKSLVAACDLKAETVIRPEHIKILSPGQGLSPQKYNELIGKKLRREMASEDYFYDSDLLSSRVEPGVYKFNRPWGIPVRYHDFNEYVIKLLLTYSNFIYHILIWI